MKKAVIAAAMIAVPIAGWPVSKEQTGRAWLQQVPALPDSAAAAYAQWIDNDGDLKAGTAFKAVEDGLADVGKDQAATAMASPQMQQQMAMAQQMQQQYGSPEGQAKLRSMSPAQLMAMAQQMQPQPMASGPVSDHDQALMGRIGAYPGTAQLQTDIQKVRNAEIALEQQWQNDREAIDKQEAQARAALPICHDEAGEPSSLALKGVALKYADLRITLASRYLPKFQALATQMRTTVLPRIDYGDSAMAAWAQLENPAMKQQVAAMARGAQSAGLADVALVQAFIEDPSKKAAQTVADRKMAERTYADARGC